jgi:outer membrane protein OmpA-like peptidoglycan-associated protein
MPAYERADTWVHLFDNRYRFEAARSHEFHFDFDSSRLKVPDGVDWQQVSHLIESDLNSIIVLEGRTDSLGGEGYNRILGQKRIDEVKRYLVIELGGAFYRIHSFSYGEAEPLYSNNDIENREKNRAVKLVVLVPHSDPERQAED